MSNLEITQRGSGPMPAKGRAVATDELTPVETPRAVGTSPDALVSTGASRGLGSLPAIPRLSAAADWAPGRTGMTGAQANTAITNAYAKLDTAMSDYLGAPTMANWTTFGKYASADAGQQIARLEAVQRLLHGEAGSVVPLVRSAWGGHGWHLFKGIGSMVDSCKQMLGLFHGVKGLSDLKENVTTLRNALVHGNTGIIQDIGPAYVQFLQTEADGKNGVDALRAKGYGRPPLDPQGYILHAFENYREAKELGRAAAALTKEHPHNRSIDIQDEVVSLNNRRRALLDHANSLLAFEEQWYTLQQPKVFDDAQVKKLMTRLSSMLAMHDVEGTHRLLLSGGNWADFVTRMGVVEVKADDPLAKSQYAIPFKDPKTGADHIYVQRFALQGMRSSVDRTQDDAILPYMTSANDSAMILGTPAPLPDYLLK